MLMIALFGLAVVSVPLAGGRFERFAELRLAALWSLTAGMGAQIAILELLPAEQVPGIALVHLASYVLVGWFVWRNRTVPGLWLMGAGGAANFAAIAVNGGVMPAHPRAWELSGLGAVEGFSNSAVTTDAPLWFLGDVFAVPASWPLANVFSVGDVLLVAGAFLLLHRVSQSRLGGGARAASCPA
jgi:hypothetical protein